MFWLGFGAENAAGFFAGVASFGVPVFFFSLFSLSLSSSSSFFSGGRPGCLFSSACFLAAGRPTSAIWAGGSTMAAHVLFLFFLFLSARVGCRSPSRPPSFCPLSPLSLSLFSLSLSLLHACKPFKTVLCQLSKAGSASRRDRYAIRICII